MSAFEIERQETPHTRIKVIGVGGAGTNAVDYMINADVMNVDFAVVNTDSRVLERSACPSKIQIGEELTHGLGAGGNPDVGYQSAEASADQLAAALENTDMLFISAGMGGGTGTGATPVLVRLAKEKNILTVAIVTKPFRFEGRQRQRRADAGLERLRSEVDTLITISNDRLLDVVGRKTSLVEAFAVTNEVLAQSVKSIANLIATPGLINVDFADIKSVMSRKGGAVLGVASAKGENRALEAIKKASSSALLDKMVIDGAQGVLICISGGPDLTLYEVDEAMNSIYDSIDEDADVIFGAVIDEQAHDEIHVTLIATGFPTVETDEPLDRPDRRKPRETDGPAGRAKAIGGEKSTPAGLAGVRGGISERTQRDGGARVVSESEILTPSQPEPPPYAPATVEAPVTQPQEPQESDEYDYPVSDTPPAGQGMPYTTPLTQPPQQPWETSPSQRPVGAAPRAPQTDNPRQTPPRPASSISDKLGESLKKKLSSMIRDDQEDGTDAPPRSGASLWEEDRTPADQDTRISE